jgi:hypothetical protein
MGGKVVNRLSLSTHALLDQSDYEKDPSVFKKDAKKYLVNIQFIYHSFLYMKRMDEKDDDYRIKTY